jgi:hypothetical protein
MTSIAVSTRETLRRAVRARCEGPEIDWLDRTLAAAAHGTQNELLAAYTGSSRFLGSRSLAVAEGGLPIDGLPGLFACDHWQLEDGARLLFLLERHHASASEAAFLEAASSCYEQGDAREQQSWLRAAPFLPGAERFLPLVVDACRTNILPLFESVACENAYPSRHFPERNFNQLVLKALFNGVALARIVGLAARANPELARMASDYADERRAAGRSIPRDIELAMAGATAARTEP